jgi:hypothetical protein
MFRQLAKRRRMSSGDKLPREDVLAPAQALAALLAPACHQIKLAGSLRRGVQMVSDIELVAIPRHFPEGNALWWLLDVLVAEGSVIKHLVVDKNGKSSPRWGNDYRAVEYGGVKFDIFCTDESSFGYQYLLRTGPADANARLMQLIYNAPFKFEKGSAWYGEDRIALPDEQAVFELLGIPYITPDKRTPQAYERALAGKHPYPDPAGILARQRVNTIAWDARYDAGDGHTWVRETRCEPITPAWAEGRSHIEQHVVFRRYAKSSPAAQHWMLHQNRLPRFLRDGYYGEFQRWQEQYVEIPNHNVDIQRGLDSRYLHFTYARESVWIETATTDRIVPLIRFAQLGKVMNEVWAIADQGVQVLDAWQGVQPHGRYPFALRFLGDDTLYLMGGQHRYLALLLHFQQDIECYVDHVPVTLEEARKGSAIKPPGLAYDKVDYDAEAWNVADVIEGAMMILAEAREFAI